MLCALCTAEVNMNVYSFVEIALRNSDMMMVGLYTCDGDWLVSSHHVFSPYLSCDGDGGA